MTILVKCKSRAHAQRHPARTRRWLSSRVIVVLWLIVGITIAPPVIRAEETLDAELDAAVERGLAFLARQQQRDGSFAGGGPKVAMTGLSLMAFLSAGHTPDAGRYGTVVRNAVDYLLAQAPEDGYFGKVDQSRMYGHGIVTLALAEAYGVEFDAARRTRMRGVIERAIQVILKAQEVKKSDPHAGGWRYTPEAGDSDLSLSGWNALALRAGQDIGIDVPADPIERAVAYVLKCYTSNSPGFAYQPGQSRTLGMTGVGVLNLRLLSDRDFEQVEAAREYLAQTPASKVTRFPVYTAYYAMQAAFQLGGETWTQAWGPTREWLLGSQLDDGGWPVSRTSEEPGRTYSTSMSILTLTIPYRLLPIYQR